MSDAGVHDSGYSWFRLAITLMIAVVGNVGIWAIIMIMPAVQAEFGVGRADASLPYTLTMVGFGLGNLLIGRAVDRFGVTRSLIGAAAAISSGFLLASAAPSIAILSGVQLLIGFGTAASFAPLIADISRWFLRRRGIAVAVAASGNYLSGAIWPMLLGGVLEAQGWRAVYAALAVVTAAVIVPLSLALRRRAGCSCCSPSPASAAAWRCRCRRCTSSPTARIWATDRRSAQRCCR